MLTVEQKQNRVEWAKKHQDDDWNHTIFTDESSFQMFRNTVRRWSKNPEIEVKRIPKNRQKVHIWGAISIKGVIGYHTFRTNLNGIYFVDIFYQVPQYNLNGGGDFNKIMTPNTQVVLPKNSLRTRFLNYLSGQRTHRT